MRRALTGSALPAGGLAAEDLQNGPGDVRRVRVRRADKRSLRRTAQPNMQRRLKELHAKKNEGSISDSACSRTSSAKWCGQHCGMNPAARFVPVATNARPFFVLMSSEQKHAGPSEPAQNRE